MCARFHAGLVAVTLTLVLAPGGAWSADPGVLPTEEEVVKEEKKESGWDPALKFGASVAIASNSDVIGQPNGSSWTLGINMLGRLDFGEDVHDWRNTLKINEVISRTPSIDQWIKTADLLHFESIYYLRLRKDVGPFISFKLEAPIFEGFDTRSDRVTYVSATDATVLATDANRFKLTDGFQPLTMKEALGAFYTPIQQKEIQIDFRGGFGAIQTLADGGLVVADDGGTPEIEIRTLEDSIQAGAVLGVEVKGELDEGRVAYGGHFEVMFPLINDDPQDRDVIDLTNLDVGLKLSFKILDWASLDYELKAVRQPELVEAWQIQNNLLFTIAYSLID